MNVQEKEPVRNTGQTMGNKNRKVAVIGVLLAVILIIAIIAGVFAGKNAQQASSDPAQDVAGQGTESASVESAESSESAGTEEVALEEDAYPQINAVMKDYYQAATDGDIEKIRTLTDSADEETLIYQQKRSAYIEEYRDLKCYTKAGPVDNSYVVYVYYEVKFKDMETLVPGISPYLVYTREDGSCYIQEGEVDEAENLYLEEISAQDDVVDLMNRVQVKFNEVVLENKDLNNYLAQMRKDLKVEVGEALAEAEAESQEQQEAAPEPEPSVNATQVRATDVVNVRASDSEQAEKLGKVQTGTVLPLLESKANGWTKVEYEGKEGYIKSDYLEALAAEGEAENGDDQAAPAEDGGAQVASGEKIKVGDTINVRKAASENADKLGVCYQGDELEILMKQADGWTRVKYKGQTGYVKTEVLKVME